MMNIQRIGLTVGIFMLFIATATSQSLNLPLNKPKVGQTVSNIVFDKIDFYKTKELKLGELKGKWIVLDFWSRFCSGCISSFPKVSQLQKELSDQVTFIMIAPDSTTGERELYANYHRKLGLKMPSAFSSKLFNYFNVQGLPFTVIIDPYGAIQGIDVSLNERKLHQLVNGETTILNQSKSRLDRAQYNSNVPFLVNGNGGNDSSFVFRTLLSNWNSNGAIFGDGATLYPQRFQKLGRFEVGGKGLEDLYLAAYTGKAGYIGVEDTSIYGKIALRPIFKISDTTLLISEIATGKNLYSYSLIVPKEKANGKYMMQIMQNDLKAYFGFDVFVENKILPYWKLIATKEARIKLKTGGGKFAIDDRGRPFQESDLKNCPIVRLIKLIASYSGIDGSDIPLLDETGILTNVDVNLDWVKGDFETCRKALNKNGLDIVKGEKEMQVIVVRDPQ